jgi:hypothetical protein
LTTESNKLKRKGGTTGLNHNKPLYNMENKQKTVKQSKTFSLSIEAFNNETK